MLSCILGVLFNSSGSDERIFYLTGAVLLVLLPLPVCRFLLDFSRKRSAVVTSLVFLLYILPAGLLILSAPAGNPSGGTETPAPAEPAEVPAEEPEPQPSAVPDPENARKCTFSLRNELPGGLNIDRDMKMSTHITSLLLAAEALFSCKAAPETPTLPYEADPVLRTPAQLRSDAFAINIFREIIREQPGNVIFSPASLESLLRLVRQGACGRTAAELDALPVAPPGGLHLHSPAAPWFMGLFEKP